MARRAAGASAQTRLPLGPSPTGCAEAGTVWVDAGRAFGLHCSWGILRVHLPWQVVSETVLCPGGMHCLLPRGYLLQTQPPGRPGGRVVRALPVAGPVRCAGAETPGGTPQPKHPPRGTGQTEPTFRKDPQCSGESATAIGGGNMEEGRVQTVPLCAKKLKKFNKGLLNAYIARHGRQIQQ